MNVPLILGLLTFVKTEVWIWISQEPSKALVNTKSPNPLNV